MSPQELPLQDVHLSVSPSWWPLAPGWWLVILGAVLLVLGAVGLWLWRRWTLRRWTLLFNSACQGSASEQLVMMSEMLRRAAKISGTGAETLSGEQWLQFLDGGRGKDFSQGAGRLLWDGAYRDWVDAIEVEKVKPLVFARFIVLLREGK